MYVYIYINSSNPIR